MKVNEPETKPVKFSPSGRSKARERLCYENIQLDTERQTEYLEIVPKHNLSV